MSHAALGCCPQHSLQVWPSESIVSLSKPSTNFHTPGLPVHHSLEESGAVLVLAMTLPITAQVASRNSRPDPVIAPMSPCHSPGRTDQITPKIAPFVAQSFLSITHQDSAESHIPTPDCPCHFPGLSQPGSSLTSVQLRTVPSKAQHHPPQPGTVPMTSQHYFKPKSQPVSV